MSVIEHLLHTIKIDYPSTNKAFFAIRQRWLLSRWAHDPQPSVHPDKIWCNNTTQRLFRPPSSEKIFATGKLPPWKLTSRDGCVITAENMKEALESHSCLKGCRAAVVQVDTCTKSVGVEQNPWNQPSEQLLIWGKGSPCLESLQSWSRLFHSVWQSNYRKARGHWTEGNSTFWCQNERTRYYCRKHSASNWNFPVHGDWICSQF